MKKFLSIVLAFLVVVMLVGCGTNVSTKKENVSIQSEETQSKIEEKTFVDQKIKDTFGEFSWPSFGKATRIPAPEWCESGRTWINDEEGYSAYVDNTTKDQYDAYVQKLYESGFNVDYSIQKKMFKACATDGYEISIIYYDDNVMFVDVWLDVE